MTNYSLVAREKGSSDPYKRVCLTPTDKELEGLNLHERTDRLNMRFSEEKTISIEDDLRAIGYETSRVVGVLDLSTLTMQVSISEATERGRLRTTSQ